jgi:hypothetical protein
MMSDFQSAVEYYLGKARSAANRGSATDLEEQLEHVESLLDHYSERSSPENISEPPREPSLVGEFTNFYRTVYDSSTTSPNPECVVLIHRYTWRGVFTGWNTNHGSVFSDLLSVAIDQYLHQCESEDVNEAIIEKGESNLRSIFQSTIGGVHEASTLTELRDIEFQFDELFSQTRRIVRETPKSGIVQASETILDLLSGLLLRPAQFETDIIDYRMQIRSEISQTESTESSDLDELRDNMALAARKHRLVRRFKQAIETLQFVGSAWITHLHLEGIVEDERYEEFAENIVYNNYSDSSNVAQQFLRLTENEGYWEMWDLRRRMDDSPGRVVSSGSATWGWLLDFYLLQMVRVLVETGDIESDLLEDNPIPEKDILRVRTSNVLERIDNLREEGTFRDLLSPPYDDNEIEAAIGHLHEAHERREEEAEESWKETIRDAEIPEPRKTRLRENLSTEILSNFKLRKIFDSVGWIGTVDEAPAEVEIESYVLGRPSYPKRVFVDDPYVAQNLNTSRISSQIASNATQCWIDAFDSTELSLPERTGIAEFLVDQVGTSDVMCFIVDIGDERRNIFDSEDFSYRSEEAEGELSDVATAGYLAGVPVITTGLDDAKAVVIDETAKTVYDRTGEGPLSIEVILGTEWQDRHPNAFSEDGDPELVVVVEVKYSFGTSGSGITVIR